MEETTIAAVCFEGLPAVHGLSFIIQNSSFRILLLLASALCLLSPAFAGTHVTGVYSVGASPAVMATVNGNPEYGWVFAQRNKSITYNNILYVNNIVTAYFDVNGNLNDGSGNLWIDLIPDANSAPGDSYYVVTINIQGAVHSEIWIVPDQTSVNVLSVRQSAAPPSGGTNTPVFFYQSLQLSGAGLAQRPTLNLAGTGVSCLDNAGLQRTDCTITGSSGTGTVTTFSAGDLSPLFTSSVATATSTPALSFTLNAVAPNTVLAGSIASGTVAPTFRALAGSDLPTPAANALGGIKSWNPAPHTWLNGIQSTGTPTATQPACTDLSDSAASCSTDATNASNISTGTLAAARLPNPSASTLGGIESLASVSHKWLNTISTSGVPGATQPDYSDLTGTPVLEYQTVAQDGTSQTQRPKLNLISGANATVTCADNAGSTRTDCTIAASASSGMSNPMTTLGDIIYENSTPTAARLAGQTTTAKEYLSQTGNGTLSATPVWAQVACGDLSNAAASCSTDATNASNISSGTLGAARLPNPSPTTLGGIESLASVTSKWINTISTSGVPSATQPAFTDISGSVTASQLPNPSATTLGGIESISCSGGNFLNSISTSGVPGCGTPAGSGTVTTTGTPSSGNLTKFSGATSVTGGDLSGDVTTSGTLTTTLANIPTATPAAGSIVYTNITAPASPAPGKVATYADSTDLRFHDKNASGLIGTTVVADAGASNNFLTAISAAGAISKAQPGFSNLSGSATCAQLPALTGNVTSSAGSCATSIASGVVNSTMVDATVKGYSFTNTSSNTMASAATDIKLVEFSLAAGYLNAANLVVNVRAAGTWSVGTSQTPTWNFKVKLCTVSGCGSGTVLTLLSWTSAASTASTTETWILNGEVGTIATGTSGTVLAHGFADLPAGATANTAFAGLHDVNTAASSAIDLTAALFLDVMANVSTQSGTKNSCTYHMAKLTP